MKLLIKRIKENNLFKNIFNLSILQIISAVLSLALIPILARILEPTKFGLVMLMHLIASYFIWFAEWGFSQGGTQKIATIRTNQDKLLKVFNQIYNSQLFLILIAIIPLFITLYFFKLKHEIDNIAIIVIMIYFMLSSSMPTWFLNGLEKVTFAVIIQIYPKIIALISVIFFIKKPEDYKYYFISLCLGLLFAILHSFFVIFKKQKIYFYFTNPLIQIKENFNYFISSFTKTMAGNIIPFFLGILTSIELFGFYTLADKIKGAVLIIVNPIFQSVFPRICNVVNQKSYYSYLKKYSLLVTFLIIILSLFVYLFIDYAIFYFVGSTFSQSSFYIKLMIPAIIMNCFVSILFYFILVPFNLSNSVMKVSLLNFIFIIIISYPLIFFLDIYGAIIVLSFCEFLVLVSYLYIIRKNKII